MGDTPSVDSVEQSDDYYHVRYADPDEFDTIRTPDWGENVADSVADGGEIRTGHEDDSDDDDDWSIQSVLVPVDDADDEDEAQDLADQIVEKANS